MAGLEDLYREIILDHYRSPRNRGELAGPSRPPGGGVQPALWRRGRRLPRGERRRRHRPAHLRPGLLDQPVVGLDDVGDREGKARRRGAHLDPVLQGDDVDPRADPRRGRGRRTATKRPVPSSPTTSASWPRSRASSSSRSASSAPRCRGTPSPRASTRSPPGCRRGASPARPAHRTRSPRVRGGAWSHSGGEPPLSFRSPGIKRSGQ